MAGKLPVPSYLILLEGLDVATREKFAIRKTSDPLFSIT